MYIFALAYEQKRQFLTCKYKKLLHHWKNLSGNRQFNENLIASHPLAGGHLTDAAINVHILLKSNI